jgi:hypothetical protein
MLATAQPVPTNPWTDAAWSILWVVLLLWLITRIRYTIDDQHVRVMLMGLTLRKVALSDIESVDTSAPLWNEHWCNTYWPWGRTVRIRRKTGLIRNFVITPANRGAFVEELRGRLGRTPE